MNEVKSFAKDSAKRLWRRKIVEFVRKHFSEKQIRNFNVFCLPGSEMLEIFEVYDELGVKRKNITGLEEIGIEYQKLKSNNDSLEDKIKVYNSSALDFVKSTNTERKFDLFSLDFCGYFDSAKDDILHYIAIRSLMRDRPILITNYLMQRESNNAQEAMQKGSFFSSLIMDMVSHSDTLSVNDIKKNLLQCADIINDKERLYETFVGKSDLTKLRDSVVQKAPISKMYDGVGYWNTPLFRKILGISSENGVKNELSEFVDMINRNRYPFSPGILIEFYERIEDARTRSVIGYFLGKDVGSFIIKDHETYKYISNSGRPMISDFYYFVEDGSYHAFENLEKSVKVQILGNKIDVLVKDSGKYAKFLSCMNRQAQDQIEATKRIDSILPIERILLTPESTEYKQPGNTIDGEEREVIISLLNEGYKSTEIIELFQEGKYTRQQIAALKTSLKNTVDDITLQTPY